MRKVVYRLAAVLVSFAAAAFSVMPLERSQADFSCWMAVLPEETAISSLSVPGTHDSGALHAFADVSGKCQAVPIEEQLEMGVRFFDIRLRQDEDSLHVVHSFVDQRTTLEEVLDAFSDFVEENPSEFLIFSFKEDTSPVRPSMPFAQCLEGYLSGCPAFQKDRALPAALGEARGKCFVLARYAGASAGVEAFDGWKDDDSFPLSQLYVQDNYRVASADEKFADIEKTLALSTEEHYDLVLNFTSCYLTSGFPPTYAAAPARDITPRLESLLESGEGSTGILVCDFMTSELSEKIIRRNFR